MMNFKNEWYGRIEDLEADIKDEGYDILESNREYITFEDPDSDEDTQYVAYLAGTESTIVVERIEEE